jgi:hypothetical protein
MEAEVIVFQGRYTEARRRIKQNQESAAQRPPGRIGGTQAKWGERRTGMENPEKFSPLRKTQLTNGLKVYLNWLRRGSI